MNFADLMRLGAQVFAPGDAGRQEQERIRQQRMERAQQARRPNNPTFVPQGPVPFMLGVQAAMAPGMKAHSNAISDVNDAISQEMRSRVSQSREQRRMQHEKEMKRMELDAMLERIRQARG